VQFIDIDVSDVVSLNAHRDDSELVQHAYVMNPAIQAAGNSVPLQFKTLQFNAQTEAKYGERIQALTDHLWPTGMDDINLPEAQQKESFSSFKDWIEARVQWVAAAGKDIHKFERGSITVKGRPHYRVGDYIRVDRGGIRWEAYVIHVAHDFQPFRRYMTTLEYIRGTQVRERKKIQNPWDVERAQS
jgi:hypothetical protein